MTTFYGGSGNDSNAGSTGNDLLYGGAGNDTLSGGAGVDTLSGNTGFDSLDGGSGDDQLVGGMGNDTIYGSYGNDEIIADGRWFDTYTLRSSTSGTASTLQVTNNADGPIDLWYIDPNGALQFVATIGVGQTFSYATLTTSNFVLEDPSGYYLAYIPGGTQSFSYDPPLADLVYGGADQDYIEAQYGNDTVYGDDGNDSIYGGSGNDLVYGGAGADLADLGAGDDSFGNWSTDAGADTVYGGDGNDYILGGNDNDLIFGGTGNDTMSGGGGSDSIYGGAGNDAGMVTDDHNQDYYDLGENTGDADELWFANYVSTTGVNVTFSGSDAGSYSYSGYASGSFVGVEEISGTEYADTLNAGADTDGVTLWGAGGADSIIGGSGNDYLDGGIGNDTIYYGSGSDTVYGGAGNDYIDDQNGVVQPGAGLIDGGDGDDTIWAGDGNDTVFGGAGNDIVSAETGDDSVDGGSGNDSLYGADGNDTLIAGLGADLVLGEAGNDLLDLTAADFAGDAAYGGAGNDTLQSRIDLDGGNDTLYGGDGADWFIAGAGDSIVGGEGGYDLDTIDLSSIPIGAAITFGGTGSGTISGSGASLNFSEIEVILGGNLADTVDGSADAGGMTYWMAAGDDSITGGSGGDTIHAGTGNDLVYGGGGADHVNGDDGQDTVYGGAGNDTLNGDGGNDLLYGEDGNDWLLTGNGNDTAYGGLGNDYLSDMAGDSWLEAGDGADSLFGGAGNDTLIGGAGDDRLSGGTGIDEFVLTAAGGNDTITDFDMALSAGLTVDQLDVAALRNLDASPVKSWDVTVSDDGAGNTLLTFPEGETVLLQGVDANTVAAPGMLAAMGVPCFAAGTSIATPHGLRAVERLRPGDLLCLADGGVAPILWTGQRRFQPAELAGRDNLLPIRIRAGSHGAQRDLLLSPQHAVEICSPGGDRALVRAGHLARLNWGARQARGVRTVVYHHLLLPDHALILAEGVRAESLYPGRLALAGFAPADRNALLHRLAAHRPQAPGQTLTEAYGPRCMPLLGFAAARRWLDQKNALSSGLFPRSENHFCRNAEMVAF